MYNSQNAANVIKSLAKSKSISISKVLSECGLNKNALYTMQSSGYFPRVEALAKIADYLGCSIDYLLGRTDVPEVNKKDKTISIAEQFQKVDRQTSQTAAYGEATTIINKKTNSMQKEELQQ